MVLNLHVKEVVKTVIQMEAPWEGRCGLPNGTSKQSLGSSAVLQGRQGTRGFRALTRESPCHSRVYCRGQGGSCAVASDGSPNSMASPAFIPKPWLGESRSAVHRASILPVRKPGPPGLSGATGAAVPLLLPFRHPAPGLRCVPLMSQSESGTKASSGREAHGRIEVKTVSRPRRKAVTYRLYKSMRCSLSTWVSWNSSPRTQASQKS